MSAAPLARDLLARVQAIAAGVRRWCEEIATHDAGRCYDRRLMGLCAIATAKLFVELQHAGIEAEMVQAFDEDVEDTGHCFVLVQHHVVDVTASQHGHEDIVIRPWSPALAVACPWWQIAAKFGDLVAFNESTSDWSDEQRPQHLLDIEMLARPPRRRCGA